MRSSDFLIEIQKAKRKKKRKKTKSKSRRYGAVFYPYYGFGMSDSSDSGGDGGGLAEMARPRVLSDEQVKEIAEFWISGETFSELARVYKVAGPTIRNSILRVFGEKKYDELEQQHLANTKYPESGRNKGIMPEQVQQMAKLFASGITLYKIGRQFGIDQSSVYGHLIILPNYKELEQQHLANTKYPESGRPKGITPEQSKEIYDLYIAGDKTLDAIGDEFDIVQADVRYHVSKIAKQLYGPDGYKKAQQERKANIENRKRLGPATTIKTGTKDGEGGPVIQGPTRKRRGFKGPLSGGSGLMENQTFDIDNKKQTIVNFINQVLQGKTPNRQYNPFYEIITGTGKVGAANSLGLDKNLQTQWKTYFQSKPYIGGQGEPWSQININDQYSKNTGDDRTLNFYVTVNKNKDNILRFFKNFYKLSSYLKPISDQYKTPLKYKTHSLLDMFISHNDSFKVYYYDPKVKDLVVNATKKFLTDNGIETGARSHEHGTDVKSGGGSFGQILSNHIYDQFLNVIKTNGNKYTTDQYFQWLKQHWPTLISQVKQKEMTESSSDNIGLAEMARPRLLSDEQVKEIAEFWASGETFYELARVYKVADTNIKKNLLRVFGEKKYDELEQQHLANTKFPDKGRQKGTTPEQVQQMAKLFASGITQREIGRRFGISHSNVKLHLNKLPNYNELEQQHSANAKYPERGIPKGITPEQAKEIYDLYIAGDKTIDAIGAKFNLTRSPIVMHVSNIAKQLYGKDGYKKAQQERKANIETRKRLGPTTIRRTDTLVGPSREGPTRKRRGFKGPLSGGSGLKENKQIVDKKSRQYTMNEVKKFKNWACQRLSIKNPPKITLSYNTKEAQNGHHTGKHVHGSDSVWVYVNNRNLVDILRTVFHELVHWRQSELNMIDHGDSYPGSAIEAMADMLAGKYIKIYGKNNRNIFQ